ncbi:MAG TPA: AbrB/MazE/SpoVT family DNA-binding domain-containing protein [Chloroflexota bacterium]|nr:AbrB/MazE/SpoVT family DNA-binding domain-containing protein [Chloroflexota bacterium]
MSMAKVQARGQVTVPQEVRDLCGIEPGTELLFVPMGPHVFECRVLPPQRSLMDLVERFTVGDVAPDLEKLREEMGESITRERLAEADHADRVTPP